MSPFFAPGQRVPCFLCPTPARVLGSLALSAPAAPLSFRGSLACQTSLSIGCTVGPSGASVACLSTQRHSCHLAMTLKRKLLDQTGFDNPPEVADEARRHTHAKPGDQEWVSRMASAVRQPLNLHQPYGVQVFTASAHRYFVFEMWEGKDGLSMDYTAYAVIN